MLLLLYHWLSIQDILYNKVDLRHKDEIKDLAVVDFGIDLTEFYQSVEWDILSVPAQRWDILTNQRSEAPRGEYLLEVEEKIFTHLREGFILKKVEFFPLGGL